MTDWTTSIFRSAAAPLPAIHSAAGISTSRLDRLLRTAGIFCFLAALAWLAHFSQFGTFGVYSDDHTWAVQALSWDPAQAWRVAWNIWCYFPEPQGRPLGFFLGYELAYLGTRIASGFTGMYLIAWAILAVNAILVERLARRVVTTGPVPILAGVFFILFPADTNRPFLCAAHILQPSLTFMLIGAHLYLSGRWWQKAICYVLVAACLLTYENAMLPILVVPLLEPLWDRAWRRRFMWHVGWTGFVVITDSVARTALGEYRVMQANHSPIITILEIIGGTIIGPTACLHSVEMRSGQGLMDSIWRHPHARAVLASGTGLFLLVIGSASRWGRWKAAVAPVSVDPVPESSPDATLSTTVFIDYQSSPAESIRRVRKPFVSTDVGRLAWFSIAAIFVSYLFSFTHFPPYLEEGQSTSTHLAAAVGGGMILAAGVGAILTVRLKNRWWKPFSLLLVSLFTATLLQYSVDEQDAYGMLWRQRQEFWAQVMDLCPDLSDGTIIICDGFVKTTRWYMPVTSWSDSYVLLQSYQFPGDWHRVPELQPFTKDNSFGPWTASVVRDADGRLTWNPEKLPYGFDQKIPRDPSAKYLPEGNVILLHVGDDNRVTRQGGSIDVLGQPFRLKPLAPRRVMPPFPTRPFYPIITGRQPYSGPVPDKSR